MSNNLELWSSVEATDTKYTKPATVNGRTFTSITPTYQQKIATKVFGPRGQGWGTVPGSESFEYKEIGTTTLLIYRAVLFYIYKGERGELPMSATETMAWITSGGKGYLKIDDEADKKVRTSAVSKALSELGFNADVFMGLFDDHEYKNMRELESQIEHAENKEKIIDVKLTELQAWVGREANAIRSIPNASVIDTVRMNLINKLQQRCHVIKASQETYNSLASSIDNAAVETINKLNNK